MPAVQLARLKNQINELTWKFTRPLEFQNNLHDLLESYGNRVFHPGKSSTGSQLVDAFHCPPLVLNQLEIDLAPLVRENPPAALSLADNLWQDPYLEPRLLSAVLLGIVPVESSQGVLNRLEKWCIPEGENISQMALLNSGMRQIRNEASTMWFGLIHNWLASNSLGMERMGLHALIPAIQDPDFENLPPIFQMIHPLVEFPPVPLMPDLIEVLQVFAKRINTETTYFLKHMLVLSDSPETVRLAMRVLPVLSQENQVRLKEALANFPTTPRK